MGSQIKRVLLILPKLLPAILIVLSVPFANIFDVFEGVPDGENEQILFRQWEKLQENGRQAEIVFLGDSSCGHGIDENVMTGFTGKKTLNLCLTASFGLESQRILLEHIQKSFPHIKVIVIMVSPFIFQRGYPDEGAYLTGILTANSDVFLERYNWKRLFKVKTAWRFLWNERKHQLFDFDPKTGFFQQKTKMIFEPKKSSVPFAISQAKRFELSRLKEACDEVSQIQCRFVQSVINDDIVVPDELGFSKVSDAVDVEFGDSKEHVAPEYRERFTLAYGKLLNLFL